MPILRTGNGGGKTEKAESSGIGRHAMSYNARLRNYNREKNELFYRLNSMTAEEIERENKRLIRKWGV